MNGGIQAISTNHFPWLLAFDVILVELCLPVDIEVAACTDIAEESLDRDSKTRQTLGHAIGND